MRVQKLEIQSDIKKWNFKNIGANEIAVGIYQQKYKKELTEAQAVDLAVKSVRAASMRDSASGDNIDVLVMNKDGAKETTENIN